MRIRNGVFVVTALGLALAAMQGCATDGVVADEEDGSTDPAPPAPLDGGKDSTPPRADSAVVDAKPPPPVDAKADTSPVDAADSAPPTDAGLVPRPGELFDPAAPAEGAPCPPGVPVNTTVSRRCGKCGTQLALCETGSIVGAYGACTGEKTAATACLPRERQVSDCGLCGRQTRDCDLSCAYVDGACQGEVVGGCVANEIDYVEGVCPILSDVRRQVCSATCTRGAPEPCAPRPIDEILVSQLAGATVSGEFSLITNKIPKLTTGTCPRTLSTVATSYQYVRVKNDGADSVNVTIANGTLAGTTTKPDTIVALYPGPGAPADRTECIDAVADSPESFTLNIAAGSSVVFHQSMYSATATNTKLHTDVKTNFVGPEVFTVAGELLVSQLAGGTVSADFDLAPLKIPKLNTGVCPRTPSATPTSYQFVRVVNDGVDSVNVTISNGNLAGTSTKPDTIVALYPGPDTPADRRNCVGSVADSPESFTVNIAAGASVMFHQNMYSATATNTKLHTDVKTNFVGPEVAPAPDYILPIAPAVGATVTQPITFDAATTAPRPGPGVCPVALSTIVSYRYVRLTNDDPVAHTVDLSGNTGLDSVLAVYPGPDGPLSADRGACIGSANDTCGGAVPGADSCLTNVTIPANGSRVVYISPYFGGTVTPTTLTVTTKS